MNCVLFAKMDQVFSKENNTKKILENWKKILEKSGKSQGILSVRKSGNPVKLKVNTLQKEHSLLTCIVLMVVYDHFCRAFDRKFWLNCKKILRANYLLTG